MDREKIARRILLLAKSLLEREAVLMNSPGHGGIYTSDEVYRELKPRRILDERSLSKLSGVDASSILMLVENTMYDIAGKHIDDLMLTNSSGIDDFMIRMLKKNRNVMKAMREHGLKFSK